MKLEENMAGYGVGGNVGRVGREGKVGWNKRSKRATRGGKLRGGEEGQKIENYDMCTEYVDGSFSFP